MLGSSVVTSSRVALCVLVIEDASDCGETGIGTVILGGDEVDTGKLSLLFSQKNLVDFWVGLVDGPSQGLDGVCKAAV